MRKCILHIGPPKSGAFTLWSDPKQRDRLLAESGIFVPASGRAKNGSHSSLVCALADMPVRNEDAACERDFAKELEEQPRGQVVVASDQLWQLLPNPDRSARIIGKLTTLGLGVFLAMHPRRQPRLINDMHAHGLRGFSHDMSFERYVGWASQGTNKFRYKRWLEIADQLGIDLLARPFKEAGSADDLVRDLLKLIGAPEGPDGYESEVKPSLGPFAADIARRLLRHAGGPARLSTKQWANLGRALRKEIKALGIVDPPYCGLTSESARRIEEHFRADNDAFAKAAWGTSWDEAFAGETGRDFSCNDYELVGLPSDKDDMYRQLLTRMARKLDSILASAPVARSGEPPTDPVGKSTHNQPWRLLPGAGTRGPAGPKRGEPHPFGTTRLCPLHSEGFPLVLMYSQKAGCTSITKWFLFQIGKLDEALKFSGWVHDYRVQVLFGKPAYKAEALRLAKSGELPVLKLVRNPYDRAVSSFLHAVELSRKHTRGPWERELIIEARTRAGKPVEEIPSLSFLDFMRHVAAIGATHDKLNGHVAQQYVPIEEIVPSRIIKLEQFAEHIRALEAEFGLLPSPLENLAKSDHHKSAAAAKQCDGSAAELDITDVMVAGHHIPPRAAFYNEETRELVRTAYTRDIEAYGYSM